MNLLWIRLQSKQGVNTQEGYSLVFFHTKTATSENVGIQFRPSRAISNFPTLKTPKLCRKKKMDLQTELWNAFEATDKLHMFLRSLSGHPFFFSQQLTL